MSYGEWEMKKKFLLFILFTPIRETSATVTINENLIVKNSLFQSNDIEAETVTINGNIFLNKKEVKETIISIGDYNVQTNIKLLSLQKSNAKNLLGIDASGNIGIENSSIEKANENNNFTSLYSNTFSPLTGNTLSINETNNSIEIGHAFNLLPINFNANNITIDSRNIQTTNINNTITCQEDVFVPSLTGKSILLTDATNIDLEEMMISGNFLLSTKTTTLPLVANLTTKTLNISTNRNNESIEDQTISIKADLITLKNFKFSSNDYSLTISKLINTDDNGFITVDNSMNYNNIKNLTFLKGENITFSVNKSINCDKNTSIIMFKGNSNQTIRIQEIQGNSNLQIGNSLNSQSNPITYTVTGNINTENLDTNSGNQYSTTTSNFKAVNFESAEFRNQITCNGKLTCVRLLTLNNIPTDYTTSGTKIVLDRNNGWIVGTEAGSSKLFKENISIFSLNKDEFLQSLEPSYVLENKEIIFTLCPEKLQTSEKCSLIKNYDNEKNPSFYEERGILGLAASQIEEIKKEIEELQYNKITLEKIIQEKIKDQEKYFISKNNELNEILEIIKKIE